MAAPPRFLGSVHTEYPDDDSIKEVTLHAVGFEISSERHVLLQWLNGTKEDVLITQVVQLTGQPGSYNYYTPVVIPCGADHNTRNQVIPVGKFAREERDKILRLANQIQFQRTSITNNCRVWLRELLVAMVDEKLITEAKFGEIIEIDPLQIRQPEQ